MTTEARDRPDLDLPTGQVTFLFTDIEGSTRPSQAVGDAFADVIDRHHRILRGAITEAGGIVVSTEGGAFFAVSTAPLLGLLGTVTGMLATFYALAEGSGGQQTMDMIAAGISEALITTETGLIIALPGLFFQFRLSREKDMYATYLARLETACMQHFLKHHKGAEPSPEATP